MRKLNCFVRGALTNLRACMSAPVFFLKKKKLEEETVLVDWITCSVHD
jgi:hypothetical protein